jgi:hypothetical protein
MPVTKTFTVKDVGNAHLILALPISLPAGFSRAAGFGATILAPSDSTMLAVPAGRGR